MLPYLIAGAIGYVVGKLFEEDEAPKYADGGQVDMLKSLFIKNGFTQDNLQRILEENSNYFNQIEFYNNETIIVYRTIALPRRLVDKFIQLDKEEIGDGIGEYWTLDKEFGSAVWGGGHYEGEETFDITCVGHLKIKDIDWEMMKYAFNDDGWHFGSESEIRGINGSNSIKVVKCDELIYEKGGLIAPNGKPSNLTPEQYKLVRTPAFKKWFGDWENDPQNASKVIDEETKEPLVVYHGYLVGGGAGRKFYEFKKLPAFFSKTKKFAYEYASTKSMDAEIDADIDTYACFLNIKKLFDSKNKENIKLAEEQLPEKIEVSHGTMWFLSAYMPKEEVIEQMKGIITIPTDDLSEDILSSNVGDIIAEKVSASQYENQILLYKDEDWGYITDAKSFDDAVQYEIAQWINNDYEKTIKYKDKYLPTLILNKETYNLELNKDPLFLEYLNEVEKRKKYYIDNVLNLLKNNLDRRINVENQSRNHNYFYVRKINLKTYKTTTKNNWTMFENETLQKFLIDNNFGGWYALERGDKTYGVYNANNIKLADGTNTTFDAGNPDIRYAGGGKVKSDYIKKIKETIEYVENSAKARMIIDFEDEEGSQQAINEGKDYERIFPLKSKPNSFVVKKIREGVQEKYDAYGIWNEKKKSYDYQYPKNTKYGDKSKEFDTLQIATYDNKGKIVGTIKIATTENKQEDIKKGAFKIAVRQDYQNKGIASKLIEKAESEGIDFVEALKNNKFTSKGRWYFISWLNKKLN